ncbi:hypothetical protein F7731_12715 [Cytobacillus depressus]|uniref:Uncharacterized protein n=1 Tax=Cytobacillus depressus TaxID=1602942 RepID=A0A6L3V5D6_9BACI|nr:hypothetical protein [Cytobacillus depressus]KAB2336339.1 hypothetical protein F7731_12715 [Cytobacillus depressus]
MLIWVMGTIIGKGFVQKERRDIIKRYFALISIAVLFLLSSCSENIEVVNIKDKSLSGQLLIQKAEDNTSSREMTKTIKDKQKIKQVLTMVEGLEVKETNSENVTNQLKEQNNYLFYFSEGEKLETSKKAPYAFSVLSDGTFIFFYKDFNAPQKPRITIEKHKELFNDIKQILEINF